MTERILRYSVYYEDGVCIASCLDVEVTTEGDTKEKAVKNLLEALELFFDDHSNHKPRLKHRYKLKELLDACQKDAEHPKTEGWDELIPIGEELI